jgi:uncharacterized protein YndB with AHSA1/START domain
MKWIKALAVGLLGLAIILAVVGLFLPSSVHVERSVAIKAPAAQVFPYINNLHNFNKWSPWARLDPDARYSFDGKDGVGARMQWVSDLSSVGSGSQEILSSVPNEYVKVALDFGAQGMAIASYELTDMENSTNLIWGFDTEFGYDLVGRYFGLMFERWIGPDYEKGLANLKTLVENNG